MTVYDIHIRIYIYIYTYTYVHIHIYQHILNVELNRLYVMCGKQCSSCIMYCKIYVALNL